MGTASFPEVKRPGRGADHPPPSKVPRSRECRAIPLPPLWAFESVTGYLLVITVCSDIHTKYMNGIGAEWITFNVKHGGIYSYF
jgi:hypothetical protein